MPGNLHRKQASVRVILAFSHLYKGQSSEYSCPQEAWVTVNTACKCNCVDEAWEGQWAEPVL